MELAANLSISNDAARSVASWRPGVLRCDDDGLAFTERGKSELEQLATGDMASVAISTHLIGADDVVVALKNGGAWSIKVSGGEQLVDALRERGVPVAKR
jgi:hypothetical protein